MKKEAKYPRETVDPRKVKPADMAKYIDHTVLYAGTKLQKIKQLCAEAKKYGFKHVCVNPFHVSYAAELLKGEDIGIACVIGFPLGANTLAVKAFETKEAVRNGATELDMVINIGAVKDADWALVEQDIAGVVKAAGKKALVKVIIETCLLTDAEKVKACKISKKAGAAFVKTSSGFNTGGATVEDVALMKKTVGEDMGVKASAGVGTFDKVVDMINAGASRIGTGSFVKEINGKK